MESEFQENTGKQQTIRMKKQHPGRLFSGKTMIWIMREPCFYTPGQGYSREGVQSDCTFQLSLCLAVVKRSE